jgi:hypothetical protein
MGQEVTVPDFAKNGPARGFAALDPNAESLADGIGQGYPTIGYRGKVWSLRYRGEQHNFVRQDDKSPLNYIDVIILGQAPNKSKSYYKKYDPNVSGERPICASLDGILPDFDVTVRQSETCALCPRNEWKINPETGNKHKECADYKRLAVLLLPALTQPILGQPLMEPAFLRVPAASLTSLALLGDTMSKQGFHFSTYVTRITFNPDTAHPEMQFKAQAPLTDQEAPTVMELRRDPIVGRITGGDLVFARPEVSRLAPPTTPPPGGGSIAAAAPQSSSMIAPAMTITPTGMAVSPSDAKVSAPPVTLEAQAISSPSLQAESPSPSLLGFPSPASGSSKTPLAGTASEVSSNSGGGVATVADTGPPEASDDELDNRIAGLIAKQ